MNNSKEMKEYISNGYAYFWDRNYRRWVAYPIDSQNRRIEWDNNDNPIEVEYFNNKRDLNKFLKSHEQA